MRSMSGLCGAYTNCLNTTLENSKEEGKRCVCNHAFSVLVKHDEG